MRKISIFLLIALFAGSTVFLAARDIRARLSPPTEEERAKLQAMLKDLRGENVMPAQKAVMEKDAMPQRAKVSYLAKSDIDRLKKAILGFIRSDEGEESEEKK